MNEVPMISYNSLCALGERLTSRLELQVWIEFGRSEGEFAIARCLASPECGDNGLTLLMATRTEKADRQEIFERPTDKVRLNLTVEADIPDMLTELADSERWRGAYVSKLVREVYNR